MLPGNCFISVPSHRVLNSVKYLLESLGLIAAMVCKQIMTGYDSKQGLASDLSCVHIYIYLYIYIYIYIHTHV